MGWTDERVELLKKLWGEGFSASQIAKQLGHITRNAVIGKVTRLGLAGRAKAAKPRAIVPRPPRPVAAPKPVLKLAGRGTVFEEAAAPPPQGHGCRAQRGAGICDDPHAGRPHVQVADRRSGGRSLHVLRSPPARGPALLHHARDTGLPGSRRTEADRQRVGPVAEALPVTGPSARLAHRLVANGVVIVVTEPDGEVRRIAVSMAEARRFGWSLLADVDPDEADTLMPADIGDGAPLPLIGGDIVDRILTAIREGAATTRAISERVRIVNTTIAARMCHMQELGLVVRTDGRRGRGGRASFALTPLGERRLAQAVAA